MKNKNRVWFWVLVFLAVLVAVGEIAFQVRGEGVTVPPGERTEPAKSVLKRKPFADLSVVSVVQSTNASVNDITEDEIEDLVRRAVTLAGGLKNIIRNGDTVVLKPNLVLMRENNGSDAPLLSPEVNGITTDWRVAKAVVRMVREVNPRGKVYVMECTAAGKTSEVMRYLKYAPEYIPGVTAFIAIDDKSGAWEDRKSAELVRVSLPDGLLHTEYYFNKIYYEAGVLISLPCLKTHSSAVVTGALKNTGIGATPSSVYGISKNNISKYNMVNHMSDDLHKWIRDYNLCRRVDFVVMDGLQGLQNGPVHTFGDLSNDQMNMRLIVAGRDAVAVDTVEALLAGWDPETVNYLKYLSRDGAGNSDTAKITVVGKPVDEVRKYLDGMSPVAGGRKIFDRDAPDFRIRGLSVNNGGLTLSLETENKVRKAEVYLDGKLLMPVVTSNFGSIFYKDVDTGGETRQVRVCVYDRFLNRSEQTAELK